MCVEKNHQFLSSIKKRSTQKKIGSFFLPHRVVIVAQKRQYVSDSVRRFVVGRWVKLPEQPAPGDRSDDAATTAAVEVRDEVKPRGADVEGTPATAGSQPEGPVVDVSTEAAMVVVRVCPRCLQKVPHSAVDNNTAATPVDEVQDRIQDTTGYATGYAWN